MNTVHAAALAACALGISFCISAHAATETDGGGLLTSVAPPPNSRSLNRQSLPAGGEQATYITSATPAGIISFYKQILPAEGWTVTDSDEESREASLEATSGRKRLALNAHGPIGTTYVKVCVWPSRPSDNRCD
jgi:hypothetical protein